MDKGNRHARLGNSSRNVLWRTGSDQFLRSDSWRCLPNTMSLAGVCSRFFLERAYRLGGLKQSDPRRFWLGARKHSSNKRVWADHRPRVYQWSISRFCFKADARASLDIGLDEFSSSWCWRMI